MENIVIQKHNQGPLTLTTEQWDSHKEQLLKDGWAPEDAPEPGVKASPKPKKAPQQ